MKKTRILVFAAALSVVACDDGGPDWPESSKLLATDVQGKTVKLEWPAPTDQDGIGGYRIKKGEEVIAELDGDARVFTAENLEGKTAYVFAVEARDKKGAWSEGLQTNVTTADAQAPTWPEGSKLEVSVESKGALGAKVVFTWSSADDDTAVTQFKLMREGDEVASFDATRESYEHQSIDAEGLYTLLAGDAAGNWSEDGPSARVWANKGMKSLFEKRGLMGSPAQNAPGFKLNLGR